MRGVDYVNIPTSPLAMVDASIGGKNGVNLGSVKNIIGIFSHPQAVLIDNDFLLLWKNENSFQHLVR